MTERPTYEELAARVKQLDATLKKYRSLVDNSPDLLYRTDSNGIITYISGSVYKLSGYTVEEAIGMNMARQVYLNPEDRFQFLNLLKEKGFVRNYQALLKRKDGSVWWASTNAHYLFDDSGEIYGVEGITRDISELKQAEGALKQSEEQFRSIIESSPMGVHLYKLQADNRLVFAGANPAADRILKVDHSQYIGLTLEEAFSSLAQTEVPARYREVCRNQIFWQTEQIEYLDDKLAGAFEVYAFNTGVDQMAAFFLDVTEKKEAERQRRQFEKMIQQAHKTEAIATLAGGVAHDFNNLLMGIQGCASLIYMDLTPNHPHMDHIEAISDCVRSASALTKQLLGFARGGKYEVKPIDLNQLIETSSTLFGRTRKEIRIHSALHSSQLIIEADFRQIEQVLLNMYVNAWQAMPTGGDLYLASSIVTLDDTYCKPHQIEPGRYAKVSITDTGIGMSEVVSRQVFDPFFTTKEKARGTGLGLASSYGIVKNHGGLITVYSEMGHGSTFNIFLPLSVKSVRVELPADQRPLGGTETILIVDDEQMVIDVGQAMMEKLGYRVMAAKGGHAAVECVRSHGPQIDLMILDLIMADMDGGKTFDIVRQMAPHIPILLCSGYSKDQKANDILQRGANGFIQKPFNISELSQQLRRLLKRSG